jgi:hypothetical protein
MSFQVCAHMEKSLDIAFEFQTQLCKLNIQCDEALQAKECTRNILKLNNRYNTKTNYALIILLIMAHLKVILMKVIGLL